MANARNIENKPHEFPEFLKSANSLEGLTMAERRKQLGTVAINTYTVAEMSEVNPLQEVEDVLKRNIIGQSGAIDSIVEALTREVLHDPDQPIANLMFIGQTGTGKSETAKLLAELINDSDDPNFNNLIRIDCQNYQESHNVATLLGSPLGYVGSEEYPKLNKETVEGGKTVILFDEIEKAHNSLRDAMLGIMDDGYLETHGENREIVSFRNSIIIMTSNLGAEEMARASDGKRAGFGPNDVPKMSDKEIDKIASREMLGVFRPEFIGRITKKVVFRGFDDEQLGEIADACLERKNERYRDHGFDITMSEKLRDYIVSQTEDRHVLNGRSVKKKLEEVVEAGLSQHFLAGTIPAGSDVYVDLDESDEVVFRYSENPALKYHMESAKQKEERMTAAQKLATTVGEVNQKGDRMLDLNGDLINDWSYEDGEYYVCGKRISDMMDLESMYHSGVITAATVVDMGSHADWFSAWSDEYSDDSDDPDDTNEMNQSGDDT